MKNTQNLLKNILFLIIIIIFSVSNANALKNPYNEKGPYGTNCTWYAWKMANEKAGVSLPGWGDAKKWYNDAKNDGYEVGTTPKSNSIIVWGNWTSYGHVGYVEKVEGNTLYVWDSAGSCIDREEPEFVECMANSVSEETDRACYSNAKRIACEYTISPSQYEITGYIYLDVAPKKETSKPSQNANSSSNKEDTSKKEPAKSSNAYLSSIELSSGTIEFDKTVNEYIIEVENEVDVLTVNATLEDKKGTLDGTGEYELNVGLNEIKLIVTAEDKTTKEYIIKVTRNEKIEVETNINEENKKVEQKVEKNDNQKSILIVVCICVLIILVVGLIIFCKSKHNKKVKNKK